MILTLQDKRKLNLQKGTQVRQKGFKSSIHALPSEVKLKLDELLAQRISPINALRSLCDEFPNVDLPSAKAVENYRNKYHTQALVKQRALRVGEMKNDMTKQELEREILNNCYYLMTKVMPQLRKRIELALELEGKSGGLPLKMTNEAVATLTRVLNVTQEIVSKNELWIATSSKNHFLKENVAQAELDNEDAKSSEQIDKILSKILEQKKLYNTL